MSKTVYLHTKCGGEISIGKRLCLKCEKKWGVIDFLMDPVGIRPVLVKEETETKKRTYASWADKLPYVGIVAGALPNWPRWARIVVFVIVIGAVYTLIYWIFGGFNA